MPLEGQSAFIPSNRRHLGYLQFCTAFNWSDLATTLKQWIGRNKITRHYRALSSTEYLMTMGRRLEERYMWLQPFICVWALMLSASERNEQRLADVKHFKISKFQDFKSTLPLHSPNPISSPLATITFSPQCFLSSSWPCLSLSQHPNRPGQQCGSNNIISGAGTELENGSLERTAGSEPGSNHIISRAGTELENGSLERITGSEQGNSLDHFQNLWIPSKEPKRAIREQKTNVILNEIETRKDGERKGVRTEGRRESWDSWAVVTRSQNQEGLRKRNGNWGTLARSMTTTGGNVSLWASLQCPEPTK